MKEKLRALETSKNHFEMLNEITGIFVGEIVSWNGKNMAEIKVFCIKIVSIIFFKQIIRKNYFLDEYLTLSLIFLWWNNFKGIGSDCLGYRSTFRKKRGFLGPIWLCLTIKLTQCQVLMVFLDVAKYTSGNRGCARIRMLQYGLKSYLSHLD